jgi:undecaprenyl diphosphate synthase
MTTESSIIQDKLPRHIAIVMDGNGRWAEKRNKPRLYGHKVGAESVREVVEAAREIGIEVLTLYAFSSENWNRPESEVSGLMTILRSYLISELSKMLKNDIRLTCSGQMDRLPKKVRTVLEDSISKTSKNSKLVLNLALSYGARDEIVRATRLIARKCQQSGLSPDDIDTEMISDHLYTKGLVDPDILIRTGGESRLSNFLLWQASYAEILFTSTMWPDFRREQFLESIVEFQRRERRFGKTTAQIKTG